MSQSPTDSSGASNHSLEDVRRHFIALQGLDSNERAAYLTALDSEELAQEVLSLFGEETLPAGEFEVGQSFGPGFLEALGASASEFFPEEASPERLGQYEILREIGRGGQAAVFLAQDTRLNRIVALKVMTGGNWLASPQARQRFEREATVAAQLDHPGICTVYEAGVSDGVSYIAMRHVEGESLAKRLSRQRRLVQNALPKPKSSSTQVSTQVDMRECVIIIEKTARALHFAHEAGVLHRDIKPGNIMMTDDGEPVLLDFGLASFEDDDLKTLTRQGDVMGTPSYMAPEQVRGDTQSINRTTDVYALGVTLFELLTLQTPFEARTVDELYRKIRLDEPLSASAINPRISEDLNTILQVALEKDQNRRYATAHALAEDLRALSEHRPIAAKRSGLLSRVAKFTRRNRGFVMAAGLLVLTLTCGIIATSLGWVKANEATNNYKKELIVSEEARKEALTVTRFLETMVTDSNRIVRKGKELSFREALDAAAKRLDKEVGGQARALATLHFIIGNDYYDLNVEDRAIHHLSESLRIRTELYGPEHLICFQTKLRLGQILQRNERLEWNLQVFKELDEHRSQLEASDVTLAARCAYHLGYAQMLKGDLRSAQVSSQRAIVLAEEHDIPEHIYADILTGHAAITRRLNSFSEAEAALVKALEILTRTHGADSAQVATVKSNLSLNIKALGRLDESAAILSEAYATKKVLYGTKHPSLLPVSCNLGKSFLDLWNYKDAYSTLYESVSMHRELLGSKDHRLAYPLAGLGDCLVLAGHAELGLAKYREAIDLAQRHLGSEHLRMAALKDALSRALIELSRPNESLPILETVIALYAKILGPDNRSVQSAKLLRLRALIDAGELEEAKAALVALRSIVAANQRLSLSYQLQVARFTKVAGDARKCLEMLLSASTEHKQKERVRPSRSALQLELEIGRTLIQLKREAEAIPQLRAFYNNYIDTVGPYDGCLKEAARLIATIEMGRKGEAEASEWKKRAQLSLPATIQPASAR